MRRIDELTQQIEALKLDAKACVDAKDAEGAKAKMKEINDVKALVEVEIELEKQEQVEVEKEITNKIQKSEGNDKIMNKLNMVEVFNKAIRGAKLTSTMLLILKVLP